MRSPNASPLPAHQITNRKHHDRPCRTARLPRGGSSHHGECPVPTIWVIFSGIANIAL